MKLEKDFPSLNYLRERLSYNRTTGEITWLPIEVKSRTDKSWNSKYSGRIAGTKREVGRGLFYQIINLDGKLIRAHHLVWIFETGEVAKGLDHISGDGMDNRYSNLRKLSHSDNIRKGRIQANNTSGVKGVSFRKDTSKWSVRLKVDGKYKSLGSFLTKEEASRVYKDKVKEITGEFFEIE